MSVQTRTPVGMHAARTCRAPTPASVTRDTPTAPRRRPAKVPMLHHPGYFFDPYPRIHMGHCLDVGCFALRLATSGPAFQEVYCTHMRLGKNLRTSWESPCTFVEDDPSSQSCLITFRWPHCVRMCMLTQSALKCVCSSAYSVPCKHTCVFSFLQTSAV